MRYNQNTRNRGGGLLVLLVVLAGVVFIAVSYKPPTVCESPLSYDIGAIDPKFKVTPEFLLKLSNDAENIWEKGMGMDLFTYKPGAEFKINLVFDERQRKTLAEKMARETLDRGGSSYDVLTKKYKSLLSAHKTKINKYDADVSMYERRLQKYNKEVAYYNNLGGAPKEKYNEMESERVELENTARRLNKALNELKVLNKEINILVDEVNKFAGNYNNDVKQYNNAFGRSVTFDQGEYTGDRINVYQFDGSSDLRLVLAHEFGHSLNLDHVENNPKSVMYYLMGKQNLKNPKLSEEDIVALKTECGLK